VASLLEFFKICSDLFRIIHNIRSLKQLSPTLAGVCPARISMSLNTLCTCCITEAASVWLFITLEH
jgi:hypothetical protein